MSKSPSYSWAFLTHRYNLALALGTSAVGVLASFPFGLDGLALSLLGLLAVEIVGVATVPALPSFQAAVDKQAANAAQEAMRNRLLTEIEKQGGSAHVRSYQQMCERVESLYRTAMDSATALTEQDVLQLDRLTIDYLRMCLSDAVMKALDGKDVAASVGKRLKLVEQSLSRRGLSQEQEQQLTRAKDEYEEILARQARMSTRRSVLEASLISMPVRIEEVYQMVMAAPSAGDLAALLEESVSKLRVAEEVAIDVEEVFGLKQASEALPVGSVSAIRPTRRAVGGRD